MVRDHLEKITANETKSVKHMDDLMVVTGDCQVGLRCILPVLPLIDCSGISEVILLPTSSFFSVTIIFIYLSSLWESFCERAENCLHKLFLLVFLILFLKTLSGNVLT